MAMIIDGYNVLHASRWLRSSRKGLDRAAFCRLLATLAGRRSEKITVVFDALPARGDTAITRTLPVKVVYSGHDRTADDVIIQMIKASTGPRDLTVVSSDRRIRSAAKRRGCKTKPAGEFIRAFDAELNQAKKHEEKRHYLKKMMSIRGFTKVHMDEKRIFEYYSKWYNPII